MQNMKEHKKYQKGEAAFIITQKLGIISPNNSTINNSFSLHTMYFILCLLISKTWD